MDFVKKVVGGDSQVDKTSDAPKQQEESSGGFLNKLNSMAGGGKESEKNEDALDKGRLSLDAIALYLAHCSAGTNMFGF